MRTSWRDPIESYRSRTSCEKERKQTGGIDELSVDYTVQQQQPYAHTPKKKFCEEKTCSLLTAPYGSPPLVSSPSCVTSASPGPQQLMGSQSTTKKEENKDPRAGESENGQHWHTGSKKEKKKKCFFFFVSFLMPSCALLCFNFFFLVLSCSNS